VIFGDDYVASKKKADTAKTKQAIRGFAPSKSKKPPLVFP
jgi:hypothetical protein